MPPQMVKIRRQILAARGMSATKTSTRPRTPPKTPNDRLKTTAMRLVEMQTGRQVEELLLTGSCREVAARLQKRGCQVDYSTVSKWIDRLKLRYSFDRLPNCTGCISASSRCFTTGICTLLERQGASLDLLATKKVAMASEGRLVKSAVGG